MTSQRQHDDPIERRREIGRRIREWRQRRGLSQIEVATIAGITQGSLSNYELGKRDVPLSTLLGIVAALDIGVGELLGIPQIVVVRDSRLGRAIERLVANPELADNVG